MLDVGCDLYVIVQIWIIHASARDLTYIYREIHCLFQRSECDQKRSSTMRYFQDESIYWPELPDMVENGVIGGYRSTCA